MAAEESKTSQLVVYIENKGQTTTVRARDTTVDM